MNKINLGAGVVNYPMPVTIVVAHVNNKPNFLTIAWVSMVNAEPPPIAIALGSHHYTNKGIKENGSFSICISSTDIIGIYAEEKYISDHKLDFGKTNPMVLSQDNREYWSLGEKIGQAWSIGKKVK